MAVATLGIVLIAFHFNKKKSVSMNSCSAMISEDRVNEKINASFQRVITIIDNEGFARDTGLLSVEHNEWIINRFYTFSLQSISGNEYELVVLSHQKSHDDNVPDAIITKLRPEQGRRARIISINEIEPDVWLFSGLAFPLFACKELNFN